MSSFNQDRNEIAATLSRLAAVLLEYSQKNAKLGIFPHARADGDALGAALSLTLALQQLGASATVFTDEELAPSLKFLPRTDNVSVYRDEKSEQQLDFVIAVDLNSPDRLERREEFFMKTEQYALIDHHVRKQENKGLELVYTKASSTCELVFRLIEELETLSSQKLFNDDIATLLIAGLMTDTGRFSYNNTTPRGLRQTAWLIEEFNVNLSTLTHELFERTTVTQLQIRGDIFASMRLEAGGRILLAAVSRDMMDQRGARDDDLDYLSSEMREADGVDVSILLRESPDRSEIQASVRSNSCLDAAAFSKHFGGGGHVRAAGFTLEDVSLAEAETLALAQAEIMLDQCKL